MVKSAVGGRFPGGGGGGCEPGAGMDMVAVIECVRPPPSVTVSVSWKVLWLGHAAHLYVAVGVVLVGRFASFVQMKLRFPAPPSSVDVDVAVHEELVEVVVHVMSKLATGGWFPGGPPPPPMNEIFSSRLGLPVPGFVIALRMAPLLSAASTCAGVDPGFEAR
jgi:hypothetical protein